ncbi:MAG: hypothetical protein ABIL20_03160 [candidate division WOR-3 bacterium]
MKGIHFTIIIIVFCVALYGDEGVAGIDGYCYYCDAHGNILAQACSVDIYCKRLCDGVVFSGNSKKYEPYYYVAQSPPGNDVYIPAGQNCIYAVAGYKWNSSGPYAGAWEMDYTGSYHYYHKDIYAGRCNIYLKKIPGTEPQGGNR